MILTALHGFLGRPTDWTGIFRGHSLDKNLKSEDLFASEILGLLEWTEKFNSRQIKTEKNILLGYSLGGRLALHALVSSPEIWTAAIIISAHLGLRTPKEKMDRQKLDEEWALRFEHDSWDKLMNDWNKRDVFKHDSFSFERLENQYSRQTLARVLRNWSLSQQCDLRQKISHLPIPILWIAGADDAIYAQQALQLTLRHSFSQIWIAPSAGHRVPWQCREKFLLKTTQFLEMVYSSNN